MLTTKYYSHTNTFWRTILIIGFVAVQLSFSAFARECQKYVFDLGYHKVNAMPGDITVTWSINTGDYACSKEEDMTGKKFVVKCESMFGEFIFQDTTDVGWYRFNTNVNSHDGVMFSFNELGTRHKEEIFVYVMPGQYPGMTTKIDTLNWCLLNGCFPNAMSMLRDMNKRELESEVVKQYHLLFPANYPGSKNFFNSYLDTITGTLVKMPYVNGVEDFIKSINASMKDRSDLPREITVFVRVSPANQIVDYEVFPASQRQAFDTARHLLSIVSNLDHTSIAVLKLELDSKMNRFSLTNERALMDQSSGRFVKKYPYLGAIH
jgi:hypothetical protein